jgi:hypothetical protein
MKNSGGWSKYGLRAKAERKRKGIRRRKREKYWCVVIEGRVPDSLLLKKSPLLATVTSAAILETESITIVTIDNHISSGIWA